MEGNSTRVDASTYLQLCVRFMGDLESMAHADKIECHAGYLPSMIDAIFLRNPRDHHVCNINYSVRWDKGGWGSHNEYCIWICLLITNSLYKGLLYFTTFVQLILTSVTDGLNFVHVIVVNDVIECGVELVEEVHHLVRGAGTRQLREAHDVAVAGKIQFITAGSDTCKPSVFEVSFRSTHLKYTVALAKLWASATRPWRRSSATGFGNIPKRRTSWLETFPQAHSAVFIYDR